MTVSGHGGLWRAVFSSSSRGERPVNLLVGGTITRSDVYMLLYRTTTVAATVATVTMGATLSQSHPRTSSLSMNKACELFFYGFPRTASAVARALRMQVAAARRGTQEREREEAEAL